MYKELDIYKLKELNKKAFEKAKEEIEKEHAKGRWDCLAFTQLSNVIKNSYYIEKMEEIEEMEREHHKMGIEHEEHREKEIKHYEKKNHEDKSEFLNFIDEIIKQHPGEGEEKIMLLLDEHMDDLRVIHPKMFDNILMRLKGMKK